MEPDKPQRRGGCLWPTVVFCLFCTCFGVMCNPVGQFRLNHTRDRLAQALIGLPKGSAEAAVRRFAIDNGLRAYDLSSEFGTYPPAPAGTVYQLVADDPYEAQFIGMSGGVRVDFWFDNGKRYISATLGSYGAAL